MLYVTDSPLENAIFLLEARLCPQDLISALAFAAYAAADVFEAGTATSHVVIAYAEAFWPRNARAILDSARLVEFVGEELPFVGDALSEEVR